METTFQDLGISFSLYKAPIKEASGYRGLGTCSICHTPQQHLFDAEEYGKEDSEVTACHSCLKAGKAIIVKDTEYGLITSEQIDTLMTHPVPMSKEEMNKSGFEEVIVEEDEDFGVWVSRKLTKNIVTELASTPNFISWQGERWLFCCQHPMTYKGVWKIEDFHKNAPNNGKQFFETIVEDIEEGLWDEKFGDCVTYYVFECKKCKRLRVYWDMA